MSWVGAAVRERLTICICIKDGEAFVDRCLESIWSETQDGMLPVVVVNHASKDRTPKLLSQWQDKFGERLRIMNFDKPGLSSVRNVAWKQAQTPWVAFVDVDCKLMAGWMGQVVAAIDTFEGQERVAAFGGNNHVPQTGDLLYRCYRMLLATYFGGHNSILNRTIAERIEVDHLPTLNVVYRKHALEKVGGFDERFIRVAEDLDLSYRLRAAGYGLWSNPGMNVEHALRPSLKAWIKNMYLYGRGRVFFIKQHQGAFEAKFLLPIAVIGMWICAVFAAFSGFNLFLVVPVIYIVLLMAALLRPLRQFEESMITSVATVGLMMLTHMAYGLGAIRELPSSKGRFA